MAIIRTAKLFLRSMWLSLTTLLLLCFSLAAQAETLNLVIQPILPAKKTLDFYQPLADYLSQKSGAQIKIVAAANFIAYWETMKRGDEYHIILDAAHFTDYRIKKMGYSVLAKVPDAVSYSLVTAEDELILEPDELIGKRIAIMSSPSLGAIRLDRMYPNTLRQPVIVESSNSREAIDNVLNGKAMGAVVPTPIASQYSNLNTVTTTDQVPHMAFSVSKKVNPNVAALLKKALVSAADDTAGKKMLEAINFPGFVDANNDTYTGHAQLLEGVWGYQQ